MDNFSKLRVGMYVDDLILERSNNRRIRDFKEKMKTLFDMTDRSLLRSYLVIQVK